MPDTVLPPRPLRRSLSALAPYVSSHLKKVVRVAALALIVASFSAVEPAVMKALFDGLVSGTGARAASVPFVALVAMLAVREVLALAQDRLFWKVRIGINF